MTGGAELLAAFLVGLLGAVHCVGMCGGIVTALTLRLPKPARLFGALPYLIAYNGGRVASYALAGALAGAFASNLLWIHRSRLVLLALAGVFLVSTGLYLAGLGNALGLVERAGAVLWRRLRPLSSRLLPVRSPWSALLLGLLWGWLPCSLVYTVLVWSLVAGGASRGAVLMAAFGAGTLPALFATGVVAARLAAFVHCPWVRRTAGALILTFGLLTFYRAMHDGMAPDVSRPAAAMHMRTSHLRLDKPTGQDHRGQQSAMEDTKRRAGEFSSETARARTWRTQGELGSMKHHRAFNAELSLTVFFLLSGK